MHAIHARLLRVAPVAAASAVLAFIEVTFTHGILVLLFVGSVSEFLTNVVVRAEAAAERAESILYQLTASAHTPEQQVRASAEWGANVLSAVARGASAEDAVTMAAATTRCASYAESEAGSETSTEQIDSIPENWVANAARSVGCSPVPLEGTRALEVQSIARMATIPECISYPRRPNGSPLRIRLSCVN
jgi:hypothetical protein